VLAVFVRGMLLQHHTRIYFEDEAANANDPVLALVPADRRGTLIAKRKPGSGNVVYTLDVHLQVDKEPVFFDV
jgi:protocatechuate 3,4-dioxygenase alpha subunit